MSDAVHNADRAELAKFEAQAEQWWDPDGPLKPLHEINPLRLNYIEYHVPLKGLSVLDVGCGGGILAEGMAARGARVIGIDLVEPSLEAARRHAEDNGVDVEYRCIDAQSMARKHAGTFDVVTCLEMLEHVPHPDAIVAACTRAVRPGGSVVFSTINRNLKSFVFAIVGAEYVLGLLPRGTHDYLKLIRPAELAGWCRTAGLDVRDLTGLHFNPLTQRYTLGGNVHVNYFCYAVKPVPRDG